MKGISKTAHAGLSPLIPAVLAPPELFTSALSPRYVTSPEQPSRHAACIVGANARQARASPKETRIKPPCNGNRIAGLISVVRRIDGCMGFSFLGGLLSTVTMHCKSERLIEVLPDGILFVS